VQELSVTLWGWSLFNQRNVSKTIGRQRPVLTANTSKDNGQGVSISTSSSNFKWLRSFSKGVLMEGF